MRNPSTLAFVLQWHGLQFLGGLAILLLGVVGWVKFEPDPPGVAWQSLPEMLGVWPYVMACIVGSGAAWVAWSKGSRLRGGR